MSGICGIYVRNGSTPPSSQHLLRMMNASPGRGQHGQNIWSSAGIALGHQLLVTTPEAVPGKQPLENPQSGCCIVFDGRLDNRDELFTLLGKIDFYTNPVTDAELVLRLYEKKGEGCPQLLLGDFAFAIWDAHSKSLFCARDIFGIKPFYYHVSDNVFIFAPEIRQVLACPGVPLALNESMAAEYLTGIITSKTETLYVHVKRLPSAHVLSVKSNQLIIKRGDDLQPQKRLWYKNDEEYTEHFMEIFSRAVAARLRCNGQVGLHLSGGLDSSSVVGMTRILGRKGVPDNTGIFSMIFPEYRELDEIVYVESVEKKWNIRSNKIPVIKYSQLNLGNEVRETREVPDLPARIVFSNLYQAVSAKGIHVLLSGFGSDELFTGSRFIYQDLLCAGQFQHLLRACRDNVCEKGWRGMLKRAGADLLWPLLPRKVRQSLLDYFSYVPRVPPWISGAFLDKVAFRQRIKQSDSGGQFPVLAEYNVYHEVTWSGELLALEYLNRCTARFGIEERYPFLDRRLVQFAMALPEQQKRGLHGEKKHILRQAGKLLLPEMVRERKDKAGFSRITLEGLQAPVARERMDFQLLASMGWISQPLTRDRYRQVLADSNNINPEYISDLYQLWIAVGLDAWLEELIKQPK